MANKSAMISVAVLYVFAYFCMELTVTSGELSYVCSLPKEVGPCRALIPQYYFNITEMKCYQFQWGGCDGNNNRFDTEKECIEMCSESSDDPTNNANETTTTPKAKKTYHRRRQNSKHRIPME